MRRRLIPLVSLTLVIVLLAAAPAAATVHRFSELFENRIHCDVANTTADWDTVSMQLKLPPFQMSLTGSYDTPGNSRGGIAVQGNYAFVCDYALGLQVINITNLAAPTLAGNYATPANAVGLFVDGNYAYVADAASGLLILNVTNPASPTLVGSYDTPGSAMDVVVEGNYAYVVDYATGLVVLNVANPAAPTLAGTCDTPGYARGIAVAGDYAYIADATAGLQVIHIANPASLRLEGSCDTPGSAYDVAVSGDRAYIADLNGGLQVMDISNPSSPTLAGSLATTGNAYGVDVEGDEAYVAAYNEGVLTIDISNPASPVLAGSYDTPGLAYDVVAAGGQAFVSDDTDGLEIVRVSLPLIQPGSGIAASATHLDKVVVDGNYAFVAGEAMGLRVFDVSNPWSPSFVGSYDTPDTARDLALSGDYLFIADGNTIQVIDVSDPTNPTYAGFYATGGTSLGVAVGGDYLYIAHAGSGLMVLNISNPLSPTYAGSYNTAGYSYHVAVAGDYAYVADGPTGLVIINISNPASPTLAGTYNTPYDAYDVTLDGDYAFVADQSSLQVIDITNAASPAYVSQSVQTGVTDVEVAGDYAYVCFGDCIEALDISNPAAMTLMWSSALHDEARGVTAAGNWIYVADYYGLCTVPVLQRAMDPTKNLGRSDAFFAATGNIMKMRLSPAWADSVMFEVSANDGASWWHILPNWAWTTVFPGLSPQWRSTLVLTEYPASPAIGVLQIEWLYESAVIDSIRDVPGDQGGQVRVHFARSAYDFDDEPNFPVATYYLWRRMDDPVALEALARDLGARTPTENASAAFEEPADADAPAGLPVVKWNGRLILGEDRSTLGQTFPPGTWEIVGSAPGAQLDQYIVVAPTLADSMASGRHDAVFLVTAHTTTPIVWYISSPESGWSVDNSPPHVPTGFEVAYNSGGGNALSWHACPDLDFEYFKIYRGTSEDFVPTPENLVQTTIDEEWLDMIEHGYLYHYKISAVDHAGNESAPALPDIVTGSDAPAVPKAFALYQNVPNPFNPVTRIRFDLPEAARVKLVVYNVNGQMIRVLADAQMPAGAREVKWDGRDSAGRAASSGIYLYRLDAGRFTQTRKMILLR